MDQCWGRIVADLPFSSAPSILLGLIKYRNTHIPQMSNCAEKLYILDSTT